MSSTSFGSDLDGVILAAGKGRRIRPFSDALPKPLLPVLDRPLLVWQLEAMRELGIENVTIVIGHLGHHIVQALGDGSRYGVRLQYVEQEHTLGIAHALSQLEGHVERPFLLFLGDIFFETKRLDSMVEAFGQEGVDAVLAVKRESDPAVIQRNFTVALNDAGFVERVVEKPRRPRNDLKGCGLYLFHDAIFDAIRRTPRTAMRDEYELTDAIQIFIEDGYGVVAAEVVERDLNLSTPDDLLQLNLHVLDRTGADRHVDPTAVLGAGVELERSVVMAGAKVAAGARLERCLVMPGERVPAGVHRDAIFVGGQVLGAD